MAWSEVGYHGTCRSIAETILASRFKPGDGRRGRGVYFWIESDLGKVLAQDWWQMKSGWNDFRLNSKPEMAILKSTVEVSDPDDVLFLENPKLNGLIAARLRPNTTPHQIGAIYETVVQLLERQRKRSYHVVIAKVDAPSREGNYPTAAGHKPYCMLVRHIDCIVSTELVS